MALLQDLGDNVPSLALSTMEYPLWTSEQVYVALRRTEGCHSDPLLKLTLGVHNIKVGLQNSVYGIIP